MVELETAQGGARPMTVDDGRNENGGEGGMVCGLYTVIFGCQVGTCLAAAARQAKQ